MEPESNKSLLASENEPTYSVITEYYLSISQQVELVVQQVGKD